MNRFDNDLMELVWEKGSIGLRSTSGEDHGHKPRERDDTKISPERASGNKYCAVLEHNTRDSFNKNLTDTQVVPVHEDIDTENPSSSHQFVDHARGDQTKGKPNFSIFLRPQLCLLEGKRKDQSSRVTKPSNDTPKISAPRSSNHVGSAMPADTRKGSKIAANHRESGTKNPEFILPDEQSTAPGHRDVCGSFNGPADYYATQKGYDEIDDSTQSSDDFEEEPECFTREMPLRTRRGSKRKRTAELHNLCEKKRREKINKKMRELQELLPNCYKVDKVSVLDEAIEYLKTLQRQIQMMSMGNGLHMPPPMLPLGMQHINTPYFPNYSPGAISMLMGHCSSPVQFSMSLIPGGVPMPMSPSPFLSNLEGSSLPSVPVPGLSGSAASLQLPGVASLSSFHNSIQKMNQEMMNNP